MVAVIIVGLLAALATPQFTERMRDRRANQAAQEVSLFYRTAKARAGGRGAAQLVRYSSSTLTRGEFRLYEAVQPIAGTATIPILSTCAGMPVSSCSAPVWDDTPLGGPDSRFVASYPEQSAVYANIYHTFKNAAGAVQSFTDICFTPSGRTFTKPSAAATGWQPLTSVPWVEVQRHKTTTGGTPVGLMRTVIIPPNGAARLDL